MEEQNNGVFLVVYGDILTDIFSDLALNITINLICDDLISAYNSKKNIYISYSVVHTYNVTINNKLAILS